MESLVESLAGSFPDELGSARGDDTLLAALFAAAEHAIAASGVRPLVLMGACQSDPLAFTAERVDRLAGSASTMFALACAASCGNHAYQPLEGRGDILTIPTLHQTDTGPFLIAADRRAGFGLVLASRRLDLPRLSSRAATHEIVWALSAEAASAALRHLAERTAHTGDDRIARALTPTEEPAIFAGAPRPRVRRAAKPGARLGTRTIGDEALAARDLSLAVAGRLLTELQSAAAYEGALASVAADLNSLEALPERLDAAAAHVGKAIDASRVSVRVRDPRAASDDDAPTSPLPVGAEEIQGAYTRIDTRRLDSIRFDRGDTTTVVARFSVPVRLDDATIGEVRVIDTRPARVWTDMERRFVERVAALVAETVCRVPAIAAESEQTADALTGLETRASFERRLHAALSEAERESEPVSLVRLRLDRLSDINETFGHAVGDATIRHVAGILRERLANDEGSALARFAGEGFAILLPGFTRVAATRVAAHLAAAVLDSPMQPIGPVSIRFGVATFPGCADTPEMLAAAARVRMLGGE